MHLPEFVKRRLRALPQWSAVAVHQPQDFIRVQLVTADSQFEVTANNVVAALRPLTVAVGLDGVLQHAIARDLTPALHFVDRDTDRTVGVLRLKHLRINRVGAAQVGVFEVVQEVQRCVQWPYRPWNRWLQNRAIRKNTDPANFSMTPRSQQQIMIFYICPRPVVLVSVDDGRHSNIFPMDLIGPLAPDTFSLALRSSSPSVETMKNARRVALSDVAACDVKIAYALGTHHKKTQVDWDTLPFGIERSMQFSLPVPATALRVREIEILDWEAIGSHTFFLSRIVSEKALQDGLQLCHTSGMYQHFMARHRRPLQSAQ